MAVRSIRGATTVTANDKDEILDATTELLREIVKRNEIHQNDMCAVFFSLTEDLNAVFPAVAARRMGLTEVPLMCMKELEVPDSLQLCIRILLQVNTDLANNQMKHVYLRGAVVLRPDLVLAED